MAQNDLHNHIIVVETDGNTLDLILSTPPHLIIDIYVQHDLFPSDHYLNNFPIKASDSRIIN